MVVSLAVGRLLPELLVADGSVYRYLGVGYGVFGVFMLAYGVVRQRQVERELLAGGFARLPAWVALTIGTSGLTLAVATVATLFTGN